MKIRELFDKKTVFSFEIFPPKRTSPIEIIYQTLEELRDLKPDFISVTFGAGGSSQGSLGGHTIEVAGKINEYGIETVAHLPCINFSKAEIAQILSDFKANGIENILALRGDKSPDIKPCEDFKYASELVEFIAKNGDFDICGACYPETHFESQGAIEDILNLKKKVDAGASHLISQLFFDNGHFYRFRERAVLAGINVPIEAGIMPVTNKSQIERMVSLCGASLPPKFTKILARFGDNKEALTAAGIAYAVDQITDLVANGVDGIHLYTMNNAATARKITEAVSQLIAN